MKFSIIKIILLLVFCILPKIVWQQVNSSVFKLKPSLGINGCQIHGDSYSGYDKLGLFVGTAVNAKLKDKTSFEFGFYFSQKGARRNEIPKNNDYRSYKVNLNYLETPFSVYYQLNPFFSFMGGASVAYLISSSEFINKTDMSYYSNFNKLELGLNFGLTYKIQDNWHAEIRCSNSITPVRNYGIAATGIYYPNPIARYFNKGLYNNILSIFITYHIDPKKISANKK